MNMADMETAALEYLARHWSVIPLLPRGKRPAIRWQTYQRARPTEQDVHAWFSRWPDANVGIVTGRVSGLVVFDVDPAHGGEQSLAELELRYGALPHTIEAVTGGGGRHVYFLYPALPVANRAGFHAGLDFRGDGGYVVAPPSVHESGVYYAWRDGCDPRDAPLAAMPPWLVTDLRTERLRRPHTAQYWRSLLREGVQEGERNTTVASLTGHLLWHGVDPEVAAELLLCWNAVRCNPPLSEEEVLRTVASIARLHEGEG